MGVYDNYIFKLYAILIICDCFQHFTSAQEYMPQYLRAKYGNQAVPAPQTSGVKTTSGRTKTFTKTKSPYAGAGGGGGSYSKTSYSSSYSSNPYSTGGGGGSYSKTSFSSGGSPSTIHFDENESFLNQPGSANSIGSYGASPYVKSAAKTINSDCPSQPPSPKNAGIRCSSYSGCKADCIPNYQFPNGKTQIFIGCENGQWKVADTDWTTVPSCLPICLPECQNNGICVAPNQCNCPENFSGPQCQFENKPCLNYPPMPMNSRRTCRASQCTITCIPGHQFPDGSEIATMVCKNGMWAPSKDKWTTIPNCEATCTPPCLNGGNCLSFNVCQCPQDFRGPQCQYRADSCSAKKLQFNGGYNCSGTMDDFSCSISCPDSVQFEFPPEALYTCQYSTGSFQPSPIPQCLYASNMEIIPQSGSSSYYHISNSSSFGTGSHNLRKGEHTYTNTHHKYEYTQPDLPEELFSNNHDIQFKPLAQFENLEHQMITMLPKPGSCFTWGGAHYKTFDGKVYSFDSKCSHILTRDAVDNTFSIIVQNHPVCYTDHTRCYRTIKIFFQDKEYFLKQSDEGMPIFASTKKVLPIPGQLPGIRVEMSAHYIVLFLDTLGIKLKWDGKEFIHVEVQESMWNRTEGLCGKIDGDINNDMLTKDGQTPRSITTLATSWKVDDLEYSCSDVPEEEHICPHSVIKESPGFRATLFCNQLISDPRFAPCGKVVDITSFMDACRWDYCSCKDFAPKVCACQTLNVYVRDCMQKGVSGLINWRDENTCPMECSGGKIYKSCGPPKGVPMCGAVSEIEDENETCVEGCYCPEGTVLHEDQCITKDKCPCRLRGKSFAPGASVPKDCNTCTCNDGQWVCTQVSCGARCAAVGDPHYITFDGKRYDFMGQCSYYLVKTDNFSIEAENVACAGSISQAMNFPATISSGLPSCTKTVTIKINGQVIKLKQNHDVVVNGQDITKIPYSIAGINIRGVSSIFLQVELPNGIEIWWDGVTRAYIDLPASFKEKTKGLCGTFNNNQKDDFLTPEDDIEQAVIPFANKWKTSEKCNDIPDSLHTHPCDINIHNKATAEKFCSKIKSQLFSECHWYVDPEQYYQDCLYDMCACEFKVSKCLCPTISAYASECSRKGVKIDWRNEVRECGIHCPGGQKYQVCGNSCTRTCTDISLRPDCKPQCVEGCNCPEGQALDDNGECIPIGQCKCQHDGLEFQAGYKEVRPAPSGLELCTCFNAIWQCKLATPEDAKRFPRAHDLKSMCDTSKNFEFTTCEDIEPVTCKNMHAPEYFTADVCHSGCKCKEGYVLDSKNKRCVKPKECPCHHGGRSYKEKSVVQSDCNTCKCQNGKWNCTDRQCTAECSAWGDSHYKTFDGKHFDYQGQCDYVLAKGSLGSDKFDITIQNVPCGSLGTSCSKSVTVRVNSGDEQETVTLTKEKLIPKQTTMKYLTVREKGIFVIVEAPELGLLIHWDKGTRVYVKVDPRWKEKIKGLCGNYNDNDADDFQTPSGGLSEASAKIFGDSWRLQSYCPKALEIEDTCGDRPDRKVWALKKCGILKSSVFAPCHSEVPLDSYFDKCIFDTCACDQGGDCECLCTALAAYAQECNNRGVPIRWRNQQLCPMQCDERCSKYSPCISTCPHETCDNLLTNAKLTKSCSEDICVEGCNPKPCPPDHVYLNTSYTECVPRNVCKPVCMEHENVTYYEGDLMEEDACHSCYCSRGEKICKGQPCSTTEPPVNTTHLLEQKVQCKSGWTKWINQDRPAPSKTKTQRKKSDIEPVPTPLILNNLKESNRCTADKMVDIECRTVKTKTSAKETGLNVECSLERGLICQSEAGKDCPDFEIRVLCQCETPTTSTPCDISRPNEEHPTDCHKFLQCQPNIHGGYEFVEKTCGPEMMYNPVTMVCDWPDTVTRIKNSCGVESVDHSKEAIKEIDNCPPGMKMDPCAIQCDKLCISYLGIIQESGECLTPGVKCASGCVSAEKKMSCPPGHFWANKDTCVSIHDCMCRSNSGRPIKPAEVVQEDECQSCQCIDNYYMCHDMCSTTLSNEGLTAVNEVQVVTETPLIIPTSITPPPKCDEDRYINLIEGDQPLPETAFNASSVLSSHFLPSYASFASGITDISGGSWAPQYTNQNQYLQIDLGRQEPVYGVIVQGSPLYDEYVTSYKVLYSPDGHNFYYALNDEKPPRPEIFRGSVDTETPVKQIFDQPFEAKIIRINPQTWNNGISLKVEIIGCSELTTTISTTPSYEYITVRPTQFKPSLCDDEMGLSDGTLGDQQISVTSEFSPDTSKKFVRLNSAKAWQPLTSSPSEWVKFDFLEPRDITGIVTKGGEKGWVTKYTVKYSHNDKDWNPITDENQNEIAFLGNFDNNSPHVNMFRLPINTRYIKVIPSKWHDVIEMRVEIRGCYKPYPTIATTSTTVPTPQDCNYCPGIDVQALEIGACRCNNLEWWDGIKCVNRTQCPCLVGHIPYDVGTVFEEEDCSECICKLGGVKHCSPKKCGNCKQGLRSTVTSTCACTCQPCPEGTILCPTSNICINSTLWCNGVQDCPDDEIDCTTTVITTPTTEPTKKPKTCPVTECQPGYRKELRKKTKYQHIPSYLSPMVSDQPRTKNHYGGSYKGIKTSVKGGNRGYIKRTSQVLQRPQPTQSFEEEICKEYKCVNTKPPPKFIHSPQECPPIICQANYIPVFDLEDTTKNKICPSYSCYPPPVPDAICNVTGRTFNTFDGTEYKYDICNHVLGRDLENFEWDVSLKKNCTTSCSRDLIINHKDHTFVMHPDLSVEFDGYKYTVEQTKSIGSQNQAFSISQLGNTLLLVSNHYGFWVIWNTLGDVKFGVVHKLVDKVDGLCGFFNENAEDDKRKPDGSPARTTIDFGDSWALAADQPAICEARACPLHIQNKAWEMCNRVKEQSLSPCARVIDIEAFISRCLETTCTCLEHSVNNHTGEEECRCNAMQSFVVDCLSTDNSIDLSDWRMQQDCPATCEAPLVYHDCYQRKCEPTCDTISNPNNCPKINNVCFPGCYCPAGYVRKEETCIKSSNCRDCECNVLPHLQYVTYDENNFTVNGNCVYVMSRDVLLKKHDQHKFQVLITNHPCHNTPEKMCVGKVTILYEGHKIHILVDYFRNKLKLIVDAERITDYSELEPWASLRETATKHFKILLIEVQVEVSIYYPSLGVSVKAPSHKYRGKLEGLCGDCNKLAEDDIKTPDGKQPKDINDFALSWLYENLPGGQTREQCENLPEKECVPLPPESDPCEQFLDVNKFGQCLNILNPGLFIEWCKKDTCGGKPDQACNAVEAYARDCASAGFCINWRNEYCPAKNCPADQYYDPCGTSTPKTCASIKEKAVVQKKRNIPVEGCYCPVDKVLLNDTCVAPKDCEVCDQEGHHPGDTWKKDKCTTCTCEGTSMKCDTQNCPGVDTICERGYNAVKVSSKDDECCDKYACIPEPTVGPICEQPQKLVCGPGQVLKLDTKPNGCQAFICECKPIDECDPIDITTQEPLEPGYLKKIDDSGCCPVIELVCKKDICPEPKECPQYHALKADEIEGKCCPLHSCEPPKDKCIFETSYIAAQDGGERLLTRYEKQKLLKNANETWTDGPCRVCKCVLSDIGNYQPTCLQIECTALELHEDYNQFELKYVPVVNQCCPKIKRTSCKYDGKTYGVGEKWSKVGDYCTVMQCIETEIEGVQRETTVKTCDTTCDIGYEYLAPKADSQECCGSCKQIACVVEGVIYNVGDEWSSADHCTNYFCLNLNGSLQVQAVKVNCPEIPDGYQNDFVYESFPIEGKCCKEHKQTACKVGNKIYKIGDTWPSPDGDKCKTINCVEKENKELIKRESIETCKRNCSKGWEYKDSPTTCCGECVQVACIVEGKLKLPGENWTSEDGCTTFICEQYVQEFTVTSQQESCPDVTDCPLEDIYVKGCCKHCNLTKAEPLSLCSPEAIPLNKTVGLIKVTRFPNGDCINKQPIPNFTECLGSCESSTQFDIKSGLHESVCSCCQATKYEPLEIELICEDGYKWNKKVAVPSKCDCVGCNAQTKSSYTKKAPTKTFVKS